LNVKNILGLASVAVVFALVSGCGGGGSGAVKVDAKITINGQAPTGPASIALPPKKAELTGKVAGFLAADGTAVFWTDGSQDSPDGLPPGEYTLALRMDPMNPGSLPNAEPYDLKVEKAGTLTIDLKPASGNRPGAGLGLPIQ